MKLGVKITFRIHHPKGGRAMRSWFLVLAGAVGLVANSGFAMHNEPSKAAGIKGVLVTAYNVCTSPNDTTTGALPLPACHPAVRSDPNCSFDVKGKGQFSAKVKAPDITVAAKLQGLAADCEGKTLQM